MHRYMNVIPTEIEDVLIIEPAVFGDERGFFFESHNAERFRGLTGIDVTFVQDNHSMSQKGILRGMHYQIFNAQDKLVRCGRGVLFDVAVDIRKGSPTYGQWAGVELSAENGKQLLIPAGFAHGFATRAPDTEIIYKCSDYYAPECEGAIRFDDADIGIDWGLTGEAILSGKDSEAGSLAEFDSPFEWKG